MSGLSHLDELEAEAIYIIREVAAQCEKPVMLYSIGKDSSVMLHLAMKAFYPEKPPFPFMHVNTTWKFKEMIEFGKTIFYYPQHDQSYLALLTNKSERKSYLRYTEQIKQYRNFYIHNPGVDIFINIETKKRFVAKKDIIQKAKSWVDLRTLFETDRSYFMDPKEMIQDDLNSISHHLDLLWGPLTQTLEEIFTHEDFGEIMNGYSRTNH